jgi:GTPase
VYLPKVVIAGRPNVGKSSIFNWLMGERIAIVDNQAGVTRDRLTGIVEADDLVFELTDTGGIGIEDIDQLTSEIERQIAMGITQADLILFIVDNQTGVVPLDREVVEQLRRYDKPILCVINKTDGTSHDASVDDFHQLGIRDMVAVSTKANRNRREFLERIEGLLPKTAKGDPLLEPEMRLAIVGRRNVGKSTFVNALAQEERMIVSEVPGTTRDSVDVRFLLDGKSFIAVDTPGLRKTKSVRSDIDFYGSTRAKSTIRRADVVLLFFDAMEPISRVDKQLCGYIEEHTKPCIFVVNKWDLAKDQAATSEWAQYLRDEFPTMAYVPIAFVTAMTGKNCKTLINHAQMLHKQSHERIATKQLNDLIHEAMQVNPPPVHMNRRPKIYYVTQIHTAPPTIAMVCSDPKGFGPQYQRYLINFLRDHVPFPEIPIRLYMQPKRQEPKDGRGDGSRPHTTKEPGESPDVWSGESAFENDEF